MDLRSNSTKRSNDECSCAQEFKRQKSISDTIPMQGLNVNEIPQPVVENEEVETQQQVEEEKIIQTHRTDDCCVFRRCLVKGKKVKEKVFSLLNNIVDGIQEPKEMQDTGTPLHLEDDHGNSVPLGIRLLSSKEGFNICRVKEGSIVKDKLRVGDKIIKVNDQDMADMEIEDVMDTFMKSKSIEISIKRRIVSEEDTVDGDTVDGDTVDGDHDSHTLEIKCRITCTDDAVDISVVDLVDCGKRQLLHSKENSQSQMCLFRDVTTKSEEQYFVRCTNTKVEAGVFDDTMSSFEVHHFIDCTIDKQVWMLKHGDNFINVSSNKHVGLIKGQIGPMLSCDGRAFIYRPYPKSLDSLLFESLEYPRHYLGIDGNVVKLINIDSDEDFSTTEGYKCRLEVKSITGTFG